MLELLRSSLPYLPATLIPLWLVLLVPLRGETWRARVAALFGVGAIALIVIAVQHSGESNTLEVYNPFPTGPDMRPTQFLIERVTAPGWHWPVAAAVFAGAISLCLFGALQRSQRAPSPVTYCLLLGTVMLAARLTFEKTAAPAELVWATGTTISQPLILFFVGVFAAQRGFSFGRFLLATIVLAILQRAIISGVGLAVTLGKWGTHLDVNSISAINTPLGGPRSFAPGDAIDRWTWAILVPQMVLWVGLTVGAGLLLGGIAWRINRA